MYDAAAPRSTIRILLADVSRLPAELLKQIIANQPDMEVVGEVQQPRDLAGEVVQRAADLVITALTRSGVPPDCRDQLFGGSGVPIIAIGGPGPFEVFNRRLMREVGTADLMAEIRKVAGQRNELPH